MTVKHDIFQKNVKSISHKQSPITLGKPLDPTSSCTYCHQEKHTRDKCFYLHGYPPWHRLYGQPKPKLKTTSNSRPTTAEVSVPTFPDHSVSSNDKITDSALFSEAQCKQLMQMIKTEFNIFLLGVLVTIIWLVLIAITWLVLLLTLIFTLPVPLIILHLMI